MEIIAVFKKKGLRRVPGGYGSEVITVKISGPHRQVHDLYGAVKARVEEEKAETEGATEDWQSIWQGWEEQ